MFKFTSEKSTFIRATKEKVWDLLYDPKAIYNLNKKLDSYEILNQKGNERIIKGKYKTLWNKKLEVIESQRLLPKEKLEFKVQPKRSSLGLVEKSEGAFILKLCIF
jgi:hypothetical protein